MFLDPAPAVVFVCPDKCFAGFELDLARGKVRAGVAGLAGVDGADGRVDCLFALADNDHIAFGNFHDQSSPANVSRPVLADQGALSYC